jgi:hypothetical protein
LLCRQELIPTWIGPAITFALWRWAKEKEDEIIELEKALVDTPPWEDDKVPPLPSPPLPSPLLSPPLPSTVPT